MTDAPHADAYDSLAAMRIPFVRWFALGRLTAVMGSQILSVTVGWELYERTHNAWSLGLVGLVQVAPVVLLMFPAGNAADRYPRRHIAMLTHVACLIAAVGLGFVAYTHAPVEIIYAWLFLLGVARAFAAPSIGTIIPQLLPPAQFANANAWISSCFELASISGPALGGFLIAITGGTTTSYVVAAVGHLIAFITFFAVPLIHPHEEARNKRSASDLFAGFEFLVHQPVFLAASTLDLFAVLLGGSVALLPVFAKDILHVGPSGLGWLRAAPSLGALLMAIVSTRLPPWKRPGRVLLITVAGFGACALGFGLSKSFALSMVCLFLSGAFDMVSVVIRSTLEQVVTPDHLRGRVRAVNAVFIGCSNELGAFESGATAAWFGPVVSVAGGGIGTLLVVAVAAIAWPTLAHVGPLHTLTPESGKTPKKFADPGAGKAEDQPQNVENL